MLIWWQLSSPRQVQREFLYTVVVTTYNHLIYQVVRIAFDKRCSDQFELRGGQSKRYDEYPHKEAMGLHWQQCFVLSECASPPCHAQPPGVPRQTAPCELAPLEGTVPQR